MYLILAQLLHCSPSVDCGAVFAVAILSGAKWFTA